MTTMTTTMTTKFYCSQKFTWLTVDLEKRSTQSCCAADPAKIDISWIKNNPGKLFNTPQLHLERQAMLDDVPVDSCKTACWTPESQGLISRRNLFQSDIKTHNTLESQPEILNIILGSDCNLTCSYCDKQYSMSWLRDIKDQGPYLDTPRFRLTPMDLIKSNVSQKEHEASDGFKTLIKEINLFKNVDKKIIITGGEPFLYNDLSNLLNNLPESPTVVVTTGLGVNHNRLKNQLDKIANIKNLNITVSAENIGQWHEFNRYGSSYSEFCKNIDLLQKYECNIKFMSVVSNLTVFGLADFAKHHANENIMYSFCVDPDFLGVNVMDPDSLNRIIPVIESSNISIREEILKNLQIPSTKEQQQQCSIFLKEFARRRNLSLDIFPQTMLQWLNI